MDKVSCVVTVSRRRADRVVLQGIHSVSLQAFHASFKS